MMVLTFVLSQCFIVKLLTKPILLRKLFLDIETTCQAEMKPVARRFVLSLDQSGSICP